MKKALVLFLVITGCNFTELKGASRPMDPNRLIFMDIVEHVFLSKCISCHHSGKTINGKAMMDLMIYNEVKTYISPKQPMKSKLFKIIFADLMPPDGKNLTTDDEKDLVAEWIRQGAVEK